MFPIITSASNIHQNVAVSLYGLKNTAVSKCVFHSEWCDAAASWHVSYCSPLSVHMWVTAAHYEFTCLILEFSNKTYIHVEFMFTSHFVCVQDFVLYSKYFWKRDQHHYYCSPTLLLLLTKMWSTSLLPLTKMWSTSLLPFTKNQCCASKMLRPSVFYLWLLYTHNTDICRCLVIRCGETYT
jgi:hypothetical protein